MFLRPTGFFSFLVLRPLAWLNCDRLTRNVGRAAEILQLMVFPFNNQKLLEDLLDFFQLHIRSHNLNRNDVRSKAYHGIKIRENMCTLVTGRMVSPKRFLSCLFSHPLIISKRLMVIMMVMQGVGFFLLEQTDEWYWRGLFSIAHLKTCLFSCNVLTETDLLSPSGDLGFSPVWDNHPRLFDMSVIILF